MSGPATGSGTSNPADAAQIVLNTIRRPVIMVDPQGLVSFANADAEDFFRSSAAILSRNTLEKLVPFGSPLLALVEQVRERKAPVNEYRVGVSSPRLGIDKVIGIGAVLAAVGGACVLLSVMLGLKSSLTIVLPAAIYLCGLGMVLPQSIAGAMTPFPERAGAASSLFGFIQQTTAAASGAVVGLLLGYGAWPMAVAIALMGLTTLVLWIATRGVRKRNAYVHRD